MTERGKAIKALECNLNFAEVAGKFDCEQCGYECRKTMFLSVPVNLLVDALALLKAQEPRVMTSEEAASSKFGYLENDMYTYMPVFIYPGWGGLKHNVHMRAYVGCEALDMPITEYGKTWRCWTSRPTEAEREATPWRL